MKAYSIILVIFTSTISIFGCGGGEEEQSTSQESPKTTPPIVETIEEIITTGDLISAPEFDLSSSSELQVSVPASPSTTISYYINVCTDFSSEADEIIINYASCKLRTTLSEAEQQFMLSLSAAENLLVAQIWPIENGAQPINQYWNIAESGNSWQISF